MEPVSVIVLSGFVGAGKTALLRRVLDESDAERVAVVTNDPSGFGGGPDWLGADGAAQALRDDAWIELACGCDGGLSASG